MSNAAELRAELKAKIEAMPTGALLAAYDDLHARLNRDDAESMVASMMAGEVSKRLRNMAKEHSTESLIADMRKYGGQAYGQMKGSDRSAYWAVTNELEERFPAAAKVANEWFDALTPEEIDNSDPNAWDDKLAGLIQAERAEA